MLRLPVLLVAVEHAEVLRLFMFLGAVDPARLDCMPTYIAVESIFVMWLPVGLAQRLRHLHSGRASLKGCVIWVAGVL